jgi:hypothetical protein
MNRNRTWACLILWIGFLVFRCAPAGAEPDYLVLSHGLTTEPVPHLAPALDAVEGRIAAWDRAFVKEGLGVRRLLSSPYGSGFLQLNRKGIDLDYLCVLDLGVLASSSPRMQAREMMGKISRALRVVQKVNRSIPDSSSLFVYYHGPFGPLGRLKQREEALNTVANQLDAIRRGGRHVAAFPDRDGTLIPTLLYPFQVVVPLNIKIRMATDRVRYYGEMFAGIRSVSVQFFFSVGLRRGDRVQYLNICPLFVRTGTVIPFFELMVNNLFLSREDARRYVQQIRHLGPREVIAFNAKRLFLASEWEFRSGRYLKQLKRMHQCYNSLMWVFAPEERDAITGSLKRWLHSDWAVMVADVIEQGDMWQEGGSRLRETFARAGALAELAAFLTKVVKTFGADVRLKTELEALRELSARFARGEYGADDFPRLKAVGRRLNQKTGPSGKEMEKMLGVFKRKLMDLGFRKVTLYGMGGDRLALLRSELADAGLDPSKVNLANREGGIPKLSPFPFEVINQVGQGHKPIRSIMFRSVFSGPRGRAFKRYYDSITWLQP